MTLESGAAKIYPKTFGSERPVFFSIPCRPRLSNFVAISAAESVTGWVCAADGFMIDLHTQGHLIMYCATSVLHEGNRSVLVGAITTATKMRLLGF